ncbi:MAG TPA: NAD(P)/FAD-dependent oxidoreductase, partial [Spirochaetales bacterium]|nr:NAD(P)/FAD-dependent oxidoreductase [Spirochaetales bacterium]
MGVDSKPAVVVGAGPAGLCAAIELKRAGAPVVLMDENGKPGGQLFKQIHKFFGSREHSAGTRGFEIGRRLLADSLELGIDVRLDTEVVGIEPGLGVWAVERRSRSYTLEAGCVILATGASENGLAFPGWTLPGVMTAGCAQTLVNVHRVLPGRRVLIVGSGNVGVIVGYQLLQAGAEVAAIIEGAPALGGYGVHTAKVRRAGVPFYCGTTILRAEGEEGVERAVIAKVDRGFKPIAGTEETLEVDTICIAVGLTPALDLAYLAGCKPIFVPELGGNMPLHDGYMRSSVEGVYVVGDTAGVEEASTAMEEGRLAGIHAAYALGFLGEAAMRERTEATWG